jgi:hypothetical protein
LHMQKKTKKKVVANKRTSKDQSCIAFAFAF